MNEASGARVTKRFMTFIELALVHNNAIRPGQRIRRAIVLRSAINNIKIELGKFVAPSQIFFNFFDFDILFRIVHN